MNIELLFKDLRAKYLSLNSWSNSNEIEKRDVSNLMENWQLHVSTIFFTHFNPDIDEQKEFDS